MDPITTTPDPMAAPGMDPRQMVAMALQAQRGLFPKNKVANMGNDLLQVWNMNQKPPMPQGGMDPVMGTGYPVPKDPVMGTGY